MNIFNSPKLKWLAQIALVLVLMSLVFAPAYDVAQADPITVIISVFVLVAGTVVVDYVSCGFNIFFYCHNKTGKDTTDPGVVLVEGRDGKYVPVPPGRNTRDGTSCFSPANACGARDDGVIEDGICSATIPSDSICCPSAPNACGMVNYEPPKDYSQFRPGSYGGHSSAGSSCSGVTVVPPPNSSCPAPVISKNFYAEPARVREDSSTTLHWKDILHATVCSLAGGGLSLGNLGLNGTRDTNKITGPTNFTLTCINGVGGPQTSVTTQVTLIPAVQEI